MVWRRTRRAGWKESTIGIVNKIHATCWLLVLASAACGDNSGVQPPTPANVAAIAGGEQSGLVGTALLDSLRVRVTDTEGNGVAGVRVDWSVLTNGSQISPATANTNSSGVASAQFTLGPSEGDQQAQAEVTGVNGSPVVFTAHGHVQPLVATTIEPLAGNAQHGFTGAVLPDSLTVRVTDGSGNGVPGVTVNWTIVMGDGTVSPASSGTNGSGVASAEFTLGQVAGEQQVQAEASGLTGSPVLFTATATSRNVTLTVVAGGNNVPERYSSDLWIHGSYGYTGTWNFRDEQGDVVKVWSLDPSGAPSPAGQVIVPNTGTVSDVQVAEDGQLLVVSGEKGGDLGEDGGVYAYSLADPAHPVFLGGVDVPFGGVHTVTLASIDGQLYAFAAKNPGFSGTTDENNPGLMIYSLSTPASPRLVHREPIPPHYGIHDTFVRDELAFVFAWDEGVIIYDVGNGIRGGSPDRPVEVSRLITAATSSSSPSVHNGWWFHNPVTGEKRYLFIGQEGPGVVGSSSSGNIHVVDVSDLAHPAEVAFFHLNGAGTHNFWVDEERQVLYAAYYNAGVIALDISGTLTGDLSGRLLSQIKPGGSGNTFTWGVQLANGSLYAIDMLSGLWQLKTE